MLLHRAAGEVREHTLTPKLSHYPHRMRSVTRPVLYRISISRLTLQVWLSMAYAASSWDAAVDLPDRFARMEDRTLPFLSSIHVKYGSNVRGSPIATPQQVLKHIYLQTGHRESAAA